MHVPQEQFLTHFRDANEIVVWISHTDPTGYHIPLLDKRKPSYVIGRSMYEFTRISEAWVKHAQEDADEIWVPCTFVQKMFFASGVSRKKVVVIPEALDTYFFDPEAHVALALPLQSSFPKWRQWENFPLPTTEAYQTRYKFYANFKWEPRKGWDILLEAYHAEFGAHTADYDKVSLYIHTFYFTNKPMPRHFDVRNISHILDDIDHFLRLRLPQVGGVSGLPHIVVVTELVQERDVARFYKTMDAFVLPTRGEGWGLPTIQAMSMGLPTISTNWGGNTEFMTQNNSFLIPIDGLEEISEDSIYAYEPGKKWGIPSLRHTGRLMRYCFENPQFAAEVGRRAREDVHKRYNEEAVADIVDQHLEEIKRRL
jgi:glycosyltransferase involved in cell wall biosynthesis